MKYYYLKLLFLAMSASMVLASCEKEVLLEEEEVFSNDTDGKSAKLTVMTRSGDAGDEAVTEGRIYIFNSSETCVQVLSTDDENTSAQAKLAAGTYTIYAVGGEDLARFTLPTLANATKSSVIGRVAGKVMDDFLWKETEVTLVDGENRNLGIELDRQVLCIDEVKITNVPDNVTKVEVGLSSFYAAIRLNGTHPNSPTETFKVALTKQSDGTTWKAEPKQLLFPSKGAPIVTVSLTTDIDLLAFSYTASGAMQANHHYDIAAAYSYAQGGMVTCTLTAKDWGEDQSITFDLDNDSHVAYHPVAGTMCYGYYVVSVDETNHTAVLLNNGTVPYTAPSAGSEAPASEWLAAFIEPMATLDRPIGITEGSWRLPTLEEVGIFSKDTQVATISSKGTSGSYFCLDGETLKWAYSKQTDNGFELKSGTAGMSSIVHLRPVIAINY
jgi:hypothetical protein